MNAQKTGKIPVFAPGVTLQIGSFFLGFVETKQSSLPKSRTSLEREIEPVQGSPGIGVAPSSEVIITLNNRLFECLRFWILIALFFPAASFAKIKVGCELTFSSAALVKTLRYDGRGAQYRTNPLNASLRAELAGRAKASCPDCTVVKTSDQKNTPDEEIYAEYKVIYPDGWWFKISFDPGAVEVQCLPFTLDFQQQFIERTTRDLFTPAEKIGLDAKLDRGGGHLNLDFEETFDGNLRLFKDFLADLINHSGIGQGMLGHDTRNAPHPSLYSDGTWERLVALFEDVESGRIQDIADFANRLNSSVYKTNLFVPSGAPPNPQKYQLFNVNHGINGFHIELRFPYPQESAQEFIDLATLFENRIQLLKKKNIPIPLRRPAPEMASPRRKVEQFIDYASQAGLPKEKIHYFVKKSIRMGLPVEGYKYYKPQGFETSLVALEIPITERKDSTSLWSKFTKACSRLAK